MLSSFLKMHQQNTKIVPALISNLPVISKSLKKTWTKSCSFQKLLAKFQRGFGRRLSTQHYLILMHKKWKQVVNTNMVLEPSSLIHQIH